MNVIERQARSIFLAAMERGLNEWPAFLDEVCGDDAALGERVHELLEAHQAMGSTDRGAPVDPDATTELAPGPGTGTVIGPYKLLEPIGEGGMGVVHMAEQTHPIRRKVALKLIKPGMDTRQIIARFEAERQTLALMDHSNIARVYDAGATESGRPYFVMELVRGIPITDYCDQANIPIPERLDLFIQVCRAVQHAHQKGIIHRDLKPSNVLVTLHDGVPVPKVIDFGIAKAMGEQLTEKTLFTGFAQLVGTPLYMSPEQAELNSPEVDTRSDIYALGVLLYELLTGTTPLEGARLRNVAWVELARLIKEDDPPPPSARLSKSHVLAKIAASRQTEPAKLPRLVRGELDWIVMKCLEKDRTRRYQTASDLAGDIQHYLDDEPVGACPPTTWYRACKFARRHKAAVVITSAICLAPLSVTAILAASNAAISQEHERTITALAAETRARVGLSESLSASGWTCIFSALLAPNASGRSTTWRGRKSSSRNVRPTSAAGNGTTSGGYDWETSPSFATSARPSAWQSAPTAGAWPLETHEASSKSGIPSPGRKSTRLTLTEGRSRACLLVPMGGPWLRRAWIKRSGSGIPVCGSRRRLSADTAAGFTAWRSAPTAAASRWPAWTAR